jgi:hypothetical protein
VDFLLRRITPWTEAVLRLTLSIDIRLGIFVLPVLLVLYLLIGLLKVIVALFHQWHRLIGLSDLSLKREMEFNADQVAVSVTGSDAPIDVLVRLPLAENALSQAVKDLSVAAESNLYTCDLFHHQAHAMGFLRQLSGKANYGVPPPLPNGPGPRADCFLPEDSALPTMWATHPSNHDREQNIKRTYVRSPVDERPAWILFHQQPKLREQSTRRFYQNRLQQARLPALTDPQRVQEFIDEEHAEVAYDLRYLGAYDDRYLEPGDLQALTALAEKNPWPAEKLAGAATELFSEPVPSAITSYHKCVGELEFLDTVHDRPEFEFRGQKHRPSEIRQLQKTVARELSDHRLHMARLDREVFLAHFQMAGQLQPDRSSELLGRYRFQLVLQAILARLSEQMDWLRGVLGFISQCKEIQEQDYNNIVNGAVAVYHGMVEVLAPAERVQLPELRNVKPGASLNRLLFGEWTVETFRISSDTAKPRSFFCALVELTQRLAKVRERAHRFHFKSLAALLALQEAIQRDFAAQTEQADHPGQPTQTGPPNDNTSVDV